MPTFILSTGRTGTVFINNVLNSLRGISAVHERNARILRFFQVMQLKNYNSAIINNIYDYMLFHPLKRDMINNESHFEINFSLKANIDKASEIFPDAVFIYIIRDPELQWQAV